MKSLKKADRTLLEMHTGMLLYGIVCQMAGVFFAGNRLKYSVSLWFGILFAAVASIHMAKTLDRALRSGQAAAKIITAGYIFRYLMVAAVLAIVGVTGTLDALVVFLGYMGLKITAYLQPLVHKLYNRLFHETDPEPWPLPDEEGQDPEEAS